MLGIQVAIGALNDRADAVRDSVAKPGKPIPAGLATPRQAVAVAVVAGALGVSLSASSGWPTATLAALGLGLGVAYDLRLSTTRWSWLPLALALPLVPAHAWLGATGSLPAGLIPLVPTGLLAGAMLAVANGLVDLERDAKTHRAAVAVTLGPARAWWLHVALAVAVAALAVFVAPAVAPAPATGGGESNALTPAAALSLDLLRWLRGWSTGLGIAALGLGAGLLRVSRPSLRERGWEMEAIGVAAVGLGWLAGVASTAGVGG